MIGAKSFEIGPEDFIRGMTTTKLTNDGGFSPETTAANLLAVPGAFYTPGPVTDKSTNCDGTIIASTQDSDGSNDRYFVSKAAGSNNGKYYTWNGTTLTVAQTDSTNSYANREGLSDMATFKGEVFFTLAAEIVKLTNNLAAIDAVWWTSTQSKTLNKATYHPMLVYEGGLYIANGNEIAFWDGSSSTQAKFTTVNTDDKITALGVDPGSGKMLVAISEGDNASDTLAQPSRVIYYNGVDNKALRVVPVDGMVTAFKNVGGTLYVFYDNKIGIWTGSGIQFLRKLNFALGDFTTLVHPQHITNIGQTLYFIDGTQIVAHGEIIGNRGKAFYNVVKNTEGDATAYHHVAAIGNNKLGLAFTTSKFFTFDTLGISESIGGGITFATKRYTFQREVTFCGITIEFDAAYPQNGNYIALQLFTSSGLQSVGSMTFSTSVANTFEMSAFDVVTPTRSIQLKGSIGAGSGGPVGIRRITVFYTPKD